MKKRVESSNNIHGYLQTNLTNPSETRWRSKNPCGFIAHEGYAVAIQLRRFLKLAVQP